MRLRSGLWRWRDVRMIAQYSEGGVGFKQSHLREHVQAR